MLPLMLPQYSVGALDIEIPNFVNKFYTKDTFVVAFANAFYSALVEDQEIDFCLAYLHKIILDPRYRMWDVVERPL